MAGETADAITDAVNKFIQGETRKMDFLMNHVIQCQKTDETVRNFLDVFLHWQEKLPDSLAMGLFRLFLTQKPWHSFEPTEAEQCLLLLVNVAIRSDKLVDQLLHTVCEQLCFPPSTSTDMTMDHFEIISSAMRELLSLLPHTEGQLIESLERALPSWGRPAPQLLTALFNVLKLCYVSPPVLSESSTQKVMGLLFSLLVDIECNVEGAADAETSTECPIAALSDPVDTEKFDENTEALSQTLTATSSSANLVLWLLVMGLRKMFPENSDASKSAKKQEWVHMCAIFRSMRSRFLQHVLPVQSTFTAYPLLLIFMCSLRPGLTVSLLENLWTHTKNTRQTDEVRVRCMSYLGDYLARSAHCSSEVLLEQLSDMTAWCVEYTYFRRSRLPPRFRAMLSEHKLFYTVFEAIIYVLTYRQAELIGTTKNRHACAVLPLGQLINCPFKPLDGVKPELRAHFLAVAAAYKMNWTATLPPGEPVDVETCPRPSFTCFFSQAARSIPFASHLSLLRDYKPAKRARKRGLENGASEQSSTVPSSSEATAEETQEPANKKRKRTAVRKFKAKHFNFNALANID